MLKLLPLGIRQESRYRKANVIAKEDSRVASCGGSQGANLAHGLAFSPVCLMLLPVVLSAGCGGITATKSISPLDFLLPGLHMRVDPPPPLLLPEGTNTLVCWQNDLQSNPIRAAG